jgi:hypothetical protein
LSSSRPDNSGPSACMRRDRLSALYEFIEVREQVFINGSLDVLVRLKDALLSPDRTTTLILIPILSVGRQNPHSSIHSLIARWDFLRQLRSLLSNHQYPSPSVSSTKHFDNGFYTSLIVVYVRLLLSLLGVGFSGRETCRATGCGWREILEKQQLNAVSSGSTSNFSLTVPSPSCE